MKKLMRKRILAALLAVMMVVCLLPAAAYAANDYVIAVPPADENKIGTTNDETCGKYTIPAQGEGVYLYEVPAGTTIIKFSNVESVYTIVEEDDGGMEWDAYPATTSPAIDLSTVNAEYLEDYNDYFVFTSVPSAEGGALYLFNVTDEDEDSYNIIVKVPEGEGVSFTATANGEQLAFSVVEDGYEFNDEYMGKIVADLYTVAVPIVYIESITLDFGENVFIFNGYDAEGYKASYGDASNGQTSVDIPDFDYYIWVQTPYVITDTSFSGGDVQFVVNFKPIFEARISGTDIVLDDIACERDGYKYTDYYGTEYIAHLYTITIPYGTEAIDFTFSDNCLAYNYIGTGEHPVTVDDTIWDPSPFIGDMVSDYLNGYNTYTLNVDTNKDGIIDYIQVQDGYNYGAELRYAITFVYDIFGAYVDGEAMTDITVTEGGYTPYVFDSETYEMVLGDPVTVYTVAIPDNTETVDLLFPENVLAYNYAASETLSSIYGEYDDINTGVNEAAVPVDADNDGNPDFIQVQTPYDASWNTTVLYAITFDCSLEPPVEPVEVTLEQLRDNIAAKYAESGVASDAQAPWLAADMAAYEAAFPQSESKLTDEQKQDMADSAIAAIASTSSQGDVAKNIIALAAMGYDPRQLTTAKEEELDAVAKLDELTFNEDGEIIGAGGYFYYTLPYILIAYQQFDDCQTQIAALKAEALAEKDSWMDTAGGTDGLTPIMLALAPYYSEDDVKEALDAAVEAVKAAQAEDGAIGGNAASTGLALAGLAAMNIDPADVKAGEGEDAKSLTDGIMTFAGDDGASIGSNGFDMEQGFRGLVALAKLGSGIYDFSGNIGSRVPAVATPAKAVVTFSVVPLSAEITVLLNGEEEIEPSATSDKTYSLDAGSYTYTVEKEGYTSESGEITITEEQADAAEEITIKINLSVIEDEEAQLVTITVKVMVHDAETCENELTYKNDADKYFSLLGDEESCEITLNAEDATAADALLAALIEFDIEYEQQSNGYFPSIGGYAEKEHGAKSGWMYMVDGTPADVAATEYKFTKDSTMVWFYTDDYTKDYGSEAFGGDDDEPATSGGTAEKPVFEDVPEDAYYAEAVDWAVENGITTGTSETTFSPDDDCTRAQMVTFLWRAAGSPAPSVTETAFTDIDSGEYYYQAVLWAVENGITTGTTETTFSPNDTVTRAQAVTFIYRYAGSPAVEKTDVFTDVDPDSYYADAVSWAYGESVTTGTSETTFSPEDDCLRAQIVTFLYRYFAD